MFDAWHQRPDATVKVKSLGQKSQRASPFAGLRLGRLASDRRPTTNGDSGPHPLAQIIDIVQQPIRRLVIAAELVDAVLGRIGERATAFRLERRPRLLVDLQVEHICGDKREYLAIAVERRAAEHLAHADMPERPQLVDERIDEALRNSHDGGPEEQHATIVPRRAGACNAPRGRVDYASPKCRMTTMTNPATTEMTGGEAVVRALVAHGIRNLYCLPGVQSDHLFNAVHDSEGALAAIHTRHEQGAAYMALGAALATGQPQAMSVVPGPGFLNATAALATAHSTGAKVVALVGQIPSRAIGKGHGLLHEIPEQLTILKLLTKWAERARDPAHAQTLVETALREVCSGRPRPVGIEIPPDILGARAAVGPVHIAELAEPPLDMTAIERAAALLSRAERPVIVVGGGAQDAGDEIRRLAEFLGAPVVSNRMGRGVIDHRHDLSHTLPGGVQFWKTCDVALGIGTRMQPALGEWGHDAALKVIRIDQDPDEMARFMSPELAIVADAKWATAALLALLKTRPAGAEARIAESRALRGKIAARLKAEIGPQMAYLQAIRDVLPDDGVLVDELTQVGYPARIAYEARRPRTFLSMGYQGTLGWGVAAALGAKHALGATPVVSISGDGGFMFNVQELATAVRHRIGCVFVVFNDGAFGNVRRIQQETYGNRVIASDLANPDFVKLADSFGVASARATSPETLRPQLEKAIASGAPTVIEVPVSQFPSPWPLIVQPRVRGAAGV